MRCSFFSGTVPLIFLLCLFLFCSWAQAQSLEEAALEMRLRLGQSMRQEHNILNELEKLQNWLRQAREEERLLKSGREELAALQAELSASLPELIEEEAAAGRQWQELRRAYQAQLRAVYLYAPEVEEWIFASDGDLHNALAFRQDLEILLNARRRGLQSLKNQAAALDLRLAGLKVRQEQLRDLAAAFNLTQEELTRLSRERLTALQDMAERQSELRQNRDNLEEAGLRLERAANLQLPQIGDSQAPDTGALEGKGKFFAPVQGTLLSDPRLKFSLLEAPPDSQVRAPWAGVVAFAQLTPGYGQLVVIDHGQRLHSVLGHMHNLRVKAGDSVYTGQIIGSLDQSGLLYTEIRMRAQTQPVGDWLFGAARPERN
ncbi:MAG: peptidoglycan DD-metalloendopeptidase family protein [Desulfarculales bacterium]|jgi:septal ring factor EnvC (AmiA/AmiB activator)|nr:peptidoglycan DD-metalloendopeptidase family protein [Desulfarculales bacterium]